MDLYKIYHDPGGFVDDIVGAARGFVLAFCGSCRGFILVIFCAPFWVLAVLASSSIISFKVFCVFNVGVPSLAGLEGVIDFPSI